MDEEQALFIMVERGLELAALVKRFEQKENALNRPWVAECIATTLHLMREASTEQQRLDVITVLALAMWQAGYEAAPKLEFVLPEGGVG